MQRRKSPAGAEFALFALPVSVIQYMPNFFFGSLLMLFGVEIIADWLIFSFRKVWLFLHPCLSPSSLAEILCRPRIVYLCCSFYVRPVHCDQGP